MKLNETVPGGKYKVGSQWVDAHGKPLAQSKPVKQSKPKTDNNNPDGGSEGDNNPSDNNPKE